MSAPRKRKRRPGRQPIPKAERLGAGITFTVRPHERKALQAMADEQGRSMSSMIREAVLATLPPDS